MNICMVNLPGEAVAGGCEVVVQLATQLLRAAGHKVTVFDHTHRDRAFSAPVMRSDEARTRAALAEWLSREQPDIIHIHNLGSRLILADLAATGRAVRTLHDVGGACPTGKLLRPDGGICPEPACAAACGLWHQPRRWLRWHRQRALNRKMPLLVPSEFMRRAYARIGYPGLTVVPHCFAGALPDVPAPAQPLALFVGRLQPEKGLADFLELLDTLPAGAKLAVSGDGDLRDQIAALAQTRADRFIWDDGATGIERDRLLRACCCVVMPSRQPESFGLVGFLAAAYARPTVACDAGGIREWLSGDDLVPWGDRATLRARVHHYLADPAAAGRAGRECQARYAAQFPPAQHLQQLLAVYATIGSA